ncbi:glycosyltransferase family 9 protein [Enterovibrio paralichthyis]|uniref:glycosyltransferase family 9 protein n=1 Tax=Enterovibrio paralichthyis TaxID=2853805 RepID=UPI001C48C7DC|nr:glycosyltransferase family 9 protein [Enterovibrio paralichthyis]MBV7298728.1 glycosyltransferase family 9 protein [Enterovibrio paralichthyis]
MKKILVIRNDKIGDFMLAWPAFAMLKQSMPDAEITALVPSYTKALADLCPSIDKVLVDCGKKADKQSKKQLVADIKAQGFDASICLFSDSYNATLVWKAGIPFRLAPATKISQFLYNHRITQRRSQSAKPEFEYNLDLIRAFLAKQSVPVKEPCAPYLTFSSEVLSEQKTKLAGTLGLDEQKPWLYVHAGSGGSANNLSLEQYCALVAGVCEKNAIEVVLTAGPGEAEKAAELQALLAQNGVKAVVYDKNNGLEDFTRSIACASAFIAGSTGPLHIAATVDVPTIGFFPAKRSATPLRWQPINSEGRHMAFAPPTAKDKEEAADMSKIAVDDILPDVNGFLARVI